MNLRSSGTRYTALLVALLALAGCADDSKPLNTFEPRGPKAELIDSSMTLIWAIAGVILVLVVGGALVISIKNRVKPEDYDPEDLPVQTHGNVKLEWGWTFAPAILLAVIAVPTMANIFALESTNNENELDVMVIGRQWWWEYRYDLDGDGFFRDANDDGVVDDKDSELDLNLSLDTDDVSVANEFVFPAGEQIDLTITSADVIHSFWLPRLNGKRDAVPGRLHTWSVEADEPGKYGGWCTEYCGLSHARMRMSAIALEPAQFEEWLENQAKPAELPDDEEALAGRTIFQQQCASCHIIDEDFEPAAGDDAEQPFQYPDPFDVPLAAGAAPNLTHFATRSAYAGVIFSQYAGIDPNDDELDTSTYLELAEIGRRDKAQLKRWIQNAPSQKAMAPDDMRGMLPFTQLSDEQLDQTVAYLATLD